MKTKNEHAVDGFSAVQMKRPLQEKFQQKTAGMSFAELRHYLDRTVEPLPPENHAIPLASRK